MVGGVEFNWEGLYAETVPELQNGHPAKRGYLVQLGALDEVDGWLALLALQTQHIVRVAPAQDSRPLDVRTVHAPHPWHGTARGSRLR